MDNHFVIHKIHQNIQDQLREKIILDFFHLLTSDKIYQHFLTIQIPHKEDTNSLSNHINYSCQGMI